MSKILTFVEIAGFSDGSNLEKTDVKVERVVKRHEPVSDVEPLEEARICVNERFHERNWLLEARRRVYYAD
jgi:hypothetical protein